MPNSLTAQDEHGSNGRQHVFQACRAMLRPIARLLIRSGVVHRELIALTREVYVDVARSEFGLRGRQTSISRTALLTGLARKEVRRISNRLESGDSAKPSHQDRITRVLSGWFHDQDYLDGSGKPLAIPAQGPAPSFADLKHRYGGDVPASAMLRELVNAGTVEKRDDNTVVPLKRNFSPNPTDPLHMIRAGSVIEDLGSTVTHNLYRTERDMPLFERRVSNTHMTEDQLPAFREFLEREGQAFLQRVDQWLSDHESTETSSRPQRLGLGMYLFKGPRRDD